VRFDDLPIYPLLPEIAKALDAGSLVLSAETGAGKTSAVPVYLVSSGFRRGSILVLEPRRLASAGMEPRPAAAILKTTPGSDAYHAAILAAAALQEREGPDSTGDFCEDLECHLGVFPGTGPDGRNTESTRRILEEAERLATRLFAVPRETDTKVGAAKTSAARSFDRKAAAAALPHVGNIMATGFPDRLARRLPGDAWEFASGRQARSRLTWPGIDWLLAVDVDAGSPLGYIRRAAPVRVDVALAALETGATESLEVQWRGLSASAWQRISNGVFTLTERRLPAVPPDALAAAFAEKLHADGLDWLPWNQSTHALVERVRFLAARKPGLVSLDPSEWTDSSLAGSIGKAAAPYLSASGQALDEAGLAHVLAALLGGSTPAKLDEEVPEFVMTPAGRKRRPVYPASGPARLSARIQEFFGMARGPRACGEPMTIELLSPADRPIQVTSDLESFWKNTYPAVRGELSRRYPRYYWPVDPHQAEPCNGPVRLPRKPCRT
jgi:ATP-dependent helicase HrpB